jgi:hypothetical protein
MARALLDLGDRRFADAAAITRSHARISAALGQVADWAYASNRIGGTPAAMAVASWMAEPRGVLVLSGPPGVGKTASAARAVSEAGGVLAWAFTSARVDGACGLLLLDGFGANEAENVWGCPSLIADRATRSRPTVITTALTEDQVRRAIPTPAHGALEFVDLSEAPDLRGLAPDMSALRRHALEVALEVDLLKVSDRCLADWASRSAEIIVSGMAVLASAGIGPAEVEARAAEIDAREEAAIAEALAAYAPPKPRVKRTPKPSRGQAATAYGIEQAGGE